MSNTLGKILRIIAIIFMGGAVAMNLLGGIGTVCAAFLTREYPSLWGMYDYRWLYQIVMILTIITGIAGGWAVYTLIRGGKTVYRNALIILLVGSVLGTIQFVASLILLGGAVPANIKMYANVITLILFIILQLPGIKEKVDFTSDRRDKKDVAAAGGMASIVIGIILLTTILWASPSHMFDGENVVERLMPHLNIGGLAMLLGGIVMLSWAVYHIAREELLEQGHDMV